MSDIIDFPDRHHVERIRRCLHCNREVGRAAIMVGAGFSRNGERKSASAPNMPTWNELVGEMYEALNPTEDPESQDYKK